MKFELLLSQEKGKVGQGSSEEMSDICRHPGAHKDLRKVVKLFCPWSFDLCIQKSCHDAPINLRHSKCYFCTHFLMSSVECGLWVGAFCINANMPTCRVKEKFLSYRSQQQGK